ncbi:sigma-70 family RNA polymerase sigma factor [Halobacillus sp. K22]|uniref:sigma-70 family RNA polymerase sigma factor n=1 Tax=Halobacillus sp. K22 TaxID=3457431 RepID=UPI003FCE332F
MIKDRDFAKVVEENKRLIYYHIRKLNIIDRNGDFFAEGLYALWQAYDTYDEEAGTLKSYINWKIRNTLIDKIRKDNRTVESETRFQDHVIHMQLYQVEDVVFDPYLWKSIRRLLTDNQWKWIYYSIIHDFSVDQIAVREGVTRDAVKNWGRHARKKLENSAALNIKTLEKYSRA